VSRPGQRVHLIQGCAEFLWIDPLVYLGKGLHLGDAGKSKIRTEKGIRILYLPQKQKARTVFQSQGAVLVVLIGPGGLSTIWTGWTGWTITMTIETTVWTTRIISRTARTTRTGKLLYQMPQIIIRTGLDGVWTDPRSLPATSQSVRSRPADRNRTTRTPGPPPGCRDHPRASGLRTKGKDRQKWRSLIAQRVQEPEP